MDTARTYTVNSVDRALQLLLIMARRAEPQGVTELSKILQVQKSTVHSLLQTLKQRGFVAQKADGKYTLGVTLMRLGEICSLRLDLKAEARPFMQELAAETGEIALLAVLAGDELVIIDTVEPARPFLVFPKFDFSLAIHSTAVGKVLLAYAPEEVKQRILARPLQRYTPYTIVGKRAMEEELARVRRNGYAIGCNETIDGITCIAVPIFGSGGEVLAALSVSSASSVLVSGRYRETVAILQRKAARISAHMGYHPDVTAANKNK